ncbi:hypothetical protein ACFPWQ_02100, partial [Cryobacterium melibiosiphilum]
LLCKPCHLRLHNDGWTITRTTTPDGTNHEYWLIPPTQADPNQTPIRLQSKTALHLESPFHLDS